MATESWVAPMSGCFWRIGPAENEPRLGSGRVVALNPVENPTGVFQGRHRERRPFGFQPIDGKDPGCDAQRNGFSGQGAANVTGGVTDHDDS